ncbi:hypothetical protein HY837_06090 [archaeon]|nr:hypothetical protein [archaeon]
MKDQVIIEKPEGINLYLLLQVGNNGSERLVLVSLPSKYHIELLEKYKCISNQDSEALNVLGGGMFIVEEKNKRITDYCNASKHFGGCPPDKIERLLKQKYPDYSIEQVL